MATIEHSAVTGTNANSTGATSVSLSYNHPGGWLVVFARHWSSLIADTAATFDSTAVTKLEAVNEGDTDGPTVYLFAANMTAANNTITVDFDGNSVTGRAIFAFSVSDVAGVRDSHTAGQSQDVISISNTLTTTLNDLCLQFVSWRNSGADQNSYSSGQTQLLADDSPTRADSSEKAGADTSTTLTTTLTSNANNRAAAVAISLEPSSGGEALSITIDPTTTTAPGIRIYG
jgi:hypothetical protein